jgi:transcriptional regulator with XRE-family HTH domain
VSASALARDLGIDRTLLWRWESGIYFPNTEHAKQYSEALYELYENPTVEAVRKSSSGARE